MDEPICTRDPVDALRAYAGVLKWPVTIGCRHRARQGCTCDQPDCPAPGAHPRPGRMFFPPADALVRELENAPGAAVVASTERFDALVMPRTVAMAAMVSLDRVAPVPCLVHGDRAALLVLPATGRYAVTYEDQDIEVRTGPEGWIALPPTRDVRWDTPPWFEQTATPVPLLNGANIRRFLEEAAAFIPAAEGALR